MLLRGSECCLLTGTLTEADAGCVPGAKHRDAPAAQHSGRADWTRPASRVVQPGCQGKGSL